LGCGPDAAPRTSPATTITDKPGNAGQTVVMPQRKGRQIRCFSLAVDLWIAPVERAFTRDLSPAQQP
jgi:hypothetical protein